jgi:hypothetical protein
VRVRPGAHAGTVGEKGEEKEVGVYDRWGRLAMARKEKGKGLAVDGLRLR